MSRVFTKKAGGGSKPGRAFSLLKEERVDPYDAVRKPKVFNKAGEVGGSKPSFQKKQFGKREETRSSNKPEKQEFIKHSTLESKLIAKAGPPPTTLSQGPSRRQPQKSFKTLQKPQSSFDEAAKPPTAQRQQQQRPNTRVTAIDNLSSHPEFEPEATGITMTDRIAALR
eukprot:TRINITY_DN17004_c0_g1_i1.p1 TRINITY_DN17004_c0_g1~~TRINITY_DN17004_c0_g1_i1.p1  ORF type:complete len:169 (+),score=13.12 TRINITY_DN17004_c0_g1_i1:88-594(+)